MWHCPAIEPVLGSCICLWSVWSVKDAVEFTWLKYVIVRSVVLFLVSAVERNIYDQRSLEYHIYEHHSEIKVIRRTLQQIRTGGFISPSKQLIVLVLFLNIFAV